MRQQVRFELHHKPQKKALGKKSGGGFRGGNILVSAEHKRMLKLVEEKCSGPWSIRLPEITAGQISPPSTEAAPAGPTCLQQLIPSNVLMVRDAGKDRGGVRLLRGENLEPGRSEEHLARNTHRMEMRNRFVDIKGGVWLDPLSLRGQKATNYLGDVAW